MRWASRSEKTNDGRGLLITIEFDSSPISYSRVLRCWQADAEFRSLFMSLLADSPFSAFRWETPPITIATADQPFEFVLLDSPELTTKPSQQAFARYFDSASMVRGVVEFANLGNDAVLVVPCPLTSDSAYGHVAAFVRDAPEAQRHALWKLVGEAMERRIGAKPVWLSTAGAGVPWLHVRLDDRPKYYCYGPYRNPARPGNSCP